MGGKPATGYVLRRFPAHRNKADNSFATKPNISIYSRHRQPPRAQTLRAAHRHRRTRVRQPAAQQGAGSLHATNAAQGQHTVAPVLPSSQYRKASASWIWRGLGKEAKNGVLNYAHFDEYRHDPNNHTALNRHTLARQKTGFYTASLGGIGHTVAHSHGCKHSWFA